jgi:hypothetical protein
MENLELKESSGYSDMASKGNSDNSEEDFSARYGNVSSNPEVMWRLGLELHNDEQTIFSLGSSYSTSN